MVESEWEKSIDELRDALVAGTSSGGVDFEGESETDFGAATLVTVVEASGGDTATQVQGYKELCGMLDKHLTEGANQVLGCLVIEGDPDPDALLTGLDSMLRDDGTFTPVLPLSLDQATELVNSGIALFDVVDPATALLEVAASRSSITRDVAVTALDEIDELIARHTAAE